MSLEQDPRWGGAKETKCEGQHPEKGRACREAGQEGGDRAGDQRAGLEEGSAVGGTS